METIETGLENIYKKIDRTTMNSFDISMEINLLGIELGKEEPKTKTKMIRLTPDFLKYLDQFKGKNLNALIRKRMILFPIVFNLFLKGLIYKKGSAFAIPNELYSDAEWKLIEKLYEELVG